MFKSVTILTLVLFAVALAKAQNIKEIIGPTATCPGVPVRYRVVFFPTCTAPSIVEIKKYNQAEGGGNLASVTFAGIGQLPTGEQYEDFDLVFSINFGQFPAGDLISIVFNSTCSGANFQTKGLGVDLRPPPTVSITPNDGSSTIITRGFSPGGGWRGFKTLTANVSNFVISYKWSITGESFAIAGVDDSSSVIVSSTASFPQSGTLTLRVATGTCDPVFATYSIQARPNISLSTISDTGMVIKQTTTGNVEVLLQGNPVTNNLVVKITNNGKYNISRKSLHIYDAGMHLLKTQRDYNNSSTITIDVSHLSSGIYFLQVVSDNHNVAVIKKFVIQR